MTHFETLPLWAAIPVALLLLFGGALTLIGAVGLWRLPSFYDRLHAPTLATSWGTAGIVLASILMFSVAGGRAVIHEVVIAAFIIVTTPVTLMLLGRAALHRDRVEGNMPFQFTREEEAEAKAQAQLAQAEARADIIEAQEASLAAEAETDPAQDGADVPAPAADAEPQAAAPASDDAADAPKPRKRRAPAAPAATEDGAEGAQPAPARKRAKPAPAPSEPEAEAAKPRKAPRKGAAGSGSAAKKPDSPDTAG